MNPGVLVLDDVTVARGGRDVVRGLSLSIPRGEVTALLGPNGAGKSSLVLAVAGVLPVRSGSIRVGSTPVHGLTPDRIRALGIATVPEGHRVLGGLSVADNLMVAGSRLSPSEYAEALEQVLDLLPELKDLRQRQAGRLSGGQQQMLAIAQAVLDMPDYLVIDELSLGLAPVVVRRLVPTITRIAESGVGVLLIEQFTSIALAVSTTAGVLVRGRLRLLESSRRLSSDPDLVRDAYLAGNGR